MPQTDGIPGDDTLAAELALGVLEGEDLAQARQRLIAEPAFAREVALWRDHFAVLAVHGAEVTPPSALAARVIEAVRADRPGSVLPMPARRQTGWWPTIAWAGAAAAAAVLAVLAVRPAPQTPVLMAALDVAQTHQTVFASLDATRQLHIAGHVSVPRGHDAQLWLIAGKAAPRSLGVLAVGADHRLSTAMAIPQALVAGTTLAISIEPAGGSPTGLPTGPVVASGVIQPI